MTQKKKVLMLCDHPLSTSGVGTQSRWLINGLVETGKYSFRVFGGAIKHSDYNVVTVNPDFIIKPTDGFGNQALLRHALATEKPDLLLLFNDPRFFIWVWQMEDEIHQVCPIAYNHLWDNPPWPEFNKVLYDSTDLINCINWPTYEMLKENLPPEKRVNYVPHAVPKELFKQANAEEQLQCKRNILGKEKLDHFTALYVSRNARRKMPSDILQSWKMFLDQLEEKEGHRKASLIMHTDPLDQEGPNLLHVVKLLGLVDNVIFSNDRIGFNDMSILYNACDVVINRSCNEGFGLSALEAKMCGKPVIALKTGGLTRQVLDHETGDELGVALEPEVRCLVGNQLVPYIYEDFAKHETVAAAFMKMYKLTPDEKKELSDKCKAHALKNYDLNTLIKQWDDSIENLTEEWSVETHKRWGVVEL